MSTYMYTDRQLNELNQGPNVYSVNPEFAQSKENRTKIVTAKPDNELKKGEINTITTSDGQEFFVVATKSDSATGFDGLAVAPIVNGQPDYQSVAVIAAGTDPKSSVNKAGGLISRDVAGALGASRSISPQYQVADKFVQEIIEDPRYEVSKLSGYSQGSYMLKVGAKYHIPTTTYNTWFKYKSLTKEEREYIRSNKEMFVDYRKRDDSVVFWNDFNHPELYSSDNIYLSYNPDNIYWLDGSSHKINDWIFDPLTGKVIASKGKASLVNSFNDLYANSLREIDLYKKVKQKWLSNGIDGREQIFLDAVQGQILSSGMLSTAWFAAEWVKKLAEKANKDIEDLWLKIDFSNYSELSPEEVESIFASQGITRDKYVTDFQSRINFEVEKMSDSASAFEKLHSLIQSGMDRVVMNDENLAKDFDKWKSKM